MATQTFLPSALTAIAAELAAAVSVVLTAARGSAYTFTCFKAWKDAQADRPSLAGYAVVSAGQSKDTPIFPINVSQTIAGITATVVWQHGLWEAPCQIDIYADTDVLRDELAYIVDGWLSALPYDGARTVTVSAYYSDRVRLVRSESDNGDNDSPIAGEWRHTIALQVSGRILAATTLPVLQHADVELNDVVFEVE